jgi:hypothetical protein
VTPGPIFAHGGQHWMIYNAAGGRPARRTLALASAASPLGPWRKQPVPILPPSEQVENAALYFEPANRTWFLFTNHVGLHSGHEYADAIWMYWSADPLYWDAEHKAVVVDNQSLGWGGRTVAIGLPAVLPRDGLLLIFYDRTREPFSLGVTKEPVEHCHRDIALASLALPLRVPE